MLKSLPTLAARQPEEHAAGYGLRVLQFVIATSVTAGVDTDALELAMHASVYAYGRLTTPSTADAVNAAVVLMRQTVNARRTSTRATLLAHGFTDEPAGRMPGTDTFKPTGGGSTPHGLSVEEINFVHALFVEAGGNDDAAGGTKVPAPKPSPSFPPAGMCANPF
jgi:hypothetical protein